MTDRDHIAAARRLIDALQAGEDARGLKAELAAALARYADELAERARAIEGSGLHAWRQAIDLAEDLCAQGPGGSDADEPGDAEGGSST